jgi:hypothetical protein
VESSSEGDDREGSGDMEVEIVDRMEDPPRELIPVIEEDSDDIPILEENRDPIPVPPPRIGSTENVGIVEMASQVSRQRCIRSLGQISRQALCLDTIGTEHLRDPLSRRCCIGGSPSLYTESDIGNDREAREDSPGDGVTDRASSPDVAGGSPPSPDSL